MNTRLALICIGVLMLPITGRCQRLGPVDTSGFGKDHPIHASVADVSSSVCKAISLQDGALHHYDITLSAKISFDNHSRKAAMLYRHPFVLTTRIAASSEDLASGRFIGGVDGDRMATSGVPENISINDFTVIEPGARYTSTVSTTVPLLADSNTVGLRVVNYWVQLGIDARPDKFYYEPTTQKEFVRKWQKRGELVDFLLARPFLVNIKLDPNSPVCR